MPNPTPAEIAASLTPKQRSLLERAGTRAGEGLPDLAFVDCLGIGSLFCWNGIDWTQSEMGRAVAAELEAK